MPQTSMVVANKDVVRPFDHNSVVVDLGELYGMDPVRQTVLFGAVDANGLPAWLRTPTFTAQIPQMTSNSAPSGTVTASAEYTAGSNDAWRAFDRLSSSLWSPGPSTTTGWVAYDWGSPKVIVMYEITSYSDGGFTNVNPKNWTFEGWNGATWVVLDTQTNITWSAGSQVKSFAINNSTGYNKYRLNVTANNGYTQLLLGDLQMYTLATGSVTGVDILAATTNVRVSFATGFTAGIRSDKNYTFTADVSNAWNTLGSFVTAYLYIDYNTGTPTYGFTTLRPVYSPVAPTSPATNQHWFDTINYLMKYWNGSAWATVTTGRVFIGEVTTGAGGLPLANTVVHYAYRGIYAPGRVTAAASSSVTKNHNIGSDVVTVQVLEATAANGSLRPTTLTGLTANTVTFTTGAGVLEVLPIIKRAF